MMEISLQICLVGFQFKSLLKYAANEVQVLLCETIQFCLYRKFTKWKSLSKVALVLCFR